MSDTTTRRFGLLSIVLGALLAAAVLGLWYAPENVVHADDSEAPAEELLASIGEVQITRADLLEANSRGFEQLELARQQQILDHERSVHELTERTLDAVIGERLVEMEAEAREMSVDELMTAEVDAKVVEPTDEEVDAFYEQNKNARGLQGQPKEAVVPQIRQYLSQQSRQQVFRDYVDALRAKYEVQNFLEPMRLAVEAEGFPAKGPEDAPVTIVEFSDFECPYCSRVVPTLERVTQEYGDRVRLVFRQFPLHSIHPNAQKAAEASLCAHDQGSFWEMHDSMFEEQRALSVDQLKQKAARLELDTETFEQCLDSGKYRDAVMADVEAGRSAGVSGTPAMFINGRFLSGAQPYEAIAEVIDDELDRLD